MEYVTWKALKFKKEFVQTGRPFRILGRGPYLRECAVPHSRKSFDGLQALVRQGLRCDPLDGSLYVFVNRCGIQMRVLHFDRSGFCIWARRLEAGRFIADWSQVRAREMDWTALKLLLEGIEPGKRRKRYRLVREKKEETNTQSTI